MNKIYFLVIISISFSLPCFADTDLEESTQQAEYMTAEEMTPEDYAKLSEFAVKYDVSPDGQRFVLREPVVEGDSKLVIRVVENWNEEFRAREQD